MGRYRHSGIQPTNGRMGMPNRKLHQKDEDEETHTTPKEGAPPRMPLWAKHTGYNMAVLQIDAHRAEQIINTPPSSNDGGETGTWKYPHMIGTQGRYTRREMDQNTAQNDRKHAGTETTAEEISVPISRDNADKATRKNKKQ